MEINKLVITALNFIILAMLPYWMVWHFKYIKKTEHMTLDWWLQIMLVLIYLSSITAEIPALWSRWISYYQIHTKIPDNIYILTTWDRWSHLMTYILIMFTGWIITYKRVPNILKDTLS